MIHQCTRMQSNQLLMGHRKDKYYKAKEKIRTPQNCDEKFQKQENLIKILLIIDIILSKQFFLIRPRYGLQNLY